MDRGHRLNLQLHSFIVKNIITFHFNGTTYLALRVGFDLISSKHTFLKLSGSIIEDFKFNTKTYDTGNAMLISKKFCYLLEEPWLNKFVFGNPLLRLISSQEQP